MGRKLDVTVLDEGTIIIFTPVSDDAREWFAENVQMEDWQRVGAGIAVDHSYADDLLHFIRRRGLRVQVVV